MEMTWHEIVLRDYREADIDDDIRWMNRDTAWIRADTPWEKPQPVDPRELRADMLEILRTTPEDALRWRLEIEYRGRHIGFVSSYLLDERYDWVPPQEAGDPLAFYRALAVAICESDLWGRGLGTLALEAFMQYYRDNGLQEFFLETWSGNRRMMGCAMKLGFSVCRRESGVHTVAGRKYDALVMRSRRA